MISRGFSLVSLMLALALGSGAVLLGLQYYQSLRFGLETLRRRIEWQQQARFALFELARDLRMNGQAGCARLKSVPEPQSNELRIEYAPSVWRLMAVNPPEEKGGAIESLRVIVGEREAAPGALLVLSSCARSEPLQQGVDFQWHSENKEWLLMFEPGKQPLGHHRASLELAPLVRRHYYVRRESMGAGELMRSENGGPPLRLLTQVHDFSLRHAASGLVTVELRLGPGRELWSLRVASRQNGSALMMVLALMLGALMLLAANQRAVLDEGRMAQHQQDWWQTLQIAEAVLSLAEQRVANLDTQPGHRDGFSESCQSSGVSKPWLTGLCSRGFAHLDWLSPCEDAHCIELPLPNSQQKNYCPVVEKGRVSMPTRVPNPCFLVELLDPRYHGVGLYRVSVRAWGWAGRAEVTLQSYVSASTPPKRLAWKELP